MFKSFEQIQTTPLKIYKKVYTKVKCIFMEVVVKYVKA